MYAFDRHCFSKRLCIQSLHFQFRNSMCIKAMISAVFIYVFMTIFINLIHSFESIILILIIYLTIYMPEYSMLESDCSLQNELVKHDSITLKPIKYDKTTTIILQAC